MANITAGVSQGSIISPLLFWKYRNDIIDNITFVVKLFTDGISLLSVAHDKSASAKELTED